MNVDPFASNRVKLRVPEGQSDYINASPIILRSSKSGREKRYIATQVHMFYTTHTLHCCGDWKAKKQALTLLFHTSRVPKRAPTHTSGA